MTAQQRRDMAAQGMAMQGGRFPIANRGDLENAIRAVGRVQPDTDEARAMVRRFIIRRAAELGLSDLIPPSWNSDGSLRG
jgi:hypothetical protein